MQSQLTLTTQTRNGRTVLNHCFATPPLKLMSLPPQPDGVLRAIQMSSSPGLLAGDRIDIDITLTPDTALHLSTQAFTRVLEMAAGERADQHTRITLHEHSRLTYLPHPLVLHRGSSLFQTTRIDLADHCRLLYGEITAAGRVLNDEVFAFKRFSSRLEIRHHQKLVLTDNIQWQPDHLNPQLPGQMERYTHQLNLLFADTSADAATLQQQTTMLHECLSEHTSNHLPLLWGVSRAADQILCVRALAGHADSLQQFMQAAVAVLS